MHTIRARRVPHMCMCAICKGHPVTKIKTMKINSDGYFRFFTNIGTPENYPPYGISYDGHILYICCSNLVNCINLHSGSAPNRHCVILVYYVKGL